MPRAMRPIALRSSCEKTAAAPDRPTQGGFFCAAPKFTFEPNGTCAGAVAFSRSGDAATSEFGDAQLIRKFGDVPEDLSAL